MSERVANNISSYNSSSNYASYYRIYFSRNFDTKLVGIPELPKQLPVSALDRRWTIERKYHYRVDLISEKWYGDDYINFIWILLLYNQPKENVELALKDSSIKRSKIILPEDEQTTPNVGIHPFKDFPAGREIYIPARNTVEGRLV